MRSRGANLIVLGGMLMLTVWLMSGWATPSGIPEIAPAQAANPHARVALPAHTEGSSALSFDDESSLHGTTGWTILEVIAAVALVMIAAVASQAITTPVIRN